MHGPFWIIAGAIVIALTAGSSSAQTRRELTLDAAVDQAIRDSYKIKRLQIDIDRSKLLLEARRSVLLTKVYMNVYAPNLESAYQREWIPDGGDGHEEFIFQKKALFLSTISAQQPVILFGYPTNGYISANAEIENQLQNLFMANLQKDFRNRYYLKFSQPFFQTNRLKNDLEDAQLTLDDTRLRYAAERMNIIRDIAQSYYYIYEIACNADAYQTQRAYLLHVRNTILSPEDRDSSQSTDGMQLELELSTITENLLEMQSRLRQELANIKQRLHIKMEDSLYINPHPSIIPAKIALDSALEKAATLNPYFKRQKIVLRRQELDYLYQKWLNGFNVKFEATYGIESKSSAPSDLWKEYFNTNSLLLYAYIQIWDGSERRKRMAASKKSIEGTNLETEDKKEEIKKNVTTAVNNANENLDRFTSLMEKTGMAVSLTESSIQNYQNSRISMSDLLLVISRHKDIMLKLYQAYLGYRRALLAIMIDSFYDFEKNVDLSEIGQPPRSTVLPVENLPVIDNP
jgi:outer membrane protein TolC